MKTKIILTGFRILVFTILVATAATPANAQFGGGGGTQALPYLLSTAAHVQALADSVNLRNNWSNNKYFSLQNNISGVSSIIGSQNATHSVAFQGHFNGNNYTITVNISGTNHAGTGLFGATFNATISNLTVVGNVTGTGYTGGIIGDMHETTLSNCINRANVTVTATGASCVGGIAGCSSGGSLTNCINAGTIHAPNAVQVGGLVGDRMADVLNISACLNIGTVTGNKNVGGIAGGPSSTSPVAIIQNCINAGMIQGDESVGGITGALKISTSSISTSLNTGSVISGSVANSGGIVGNLTGGTVTGCYYDKQMCLLGGIKNGDVAGQAVGKLTAELCNINLGGNFTVTDSLYPQITTLISQTASKVAAAPAFLCAYDATDPDKANKVRRHFTVSTAGGVYWSSQNWHITFSGTEATLQSEGEEMLTAQANGWNKKVRVEVETTKNTCGNDVFYGCGAPVTVTFKINPEMDSKLRFYIVGCDPNIYGESINIDSGETNTITFEKGTQLSIGPYSIASCYKFINFTDNQGNVLNYGNLLLTEDTTIIANFEQQLYDLTLEANPPAGGTVTGAGQYNTSCDNDSVTITATPNPGYAFLYWEGTYYGNQSTDATTNIAVTHDELWIAHFAPIGTGGGGGPTTPQYKVVLIGRGITGAGNATLSGMGVYDSGSVVPIGLTWNYSAWDPDCHTLCWRNMRGDIISSDNPTNITVISDTVLYAEYMQKHFTNFVVAGPGGTVIDTLRGYNYPPISWCYTDDRACNSTDILAIPNPCYKFVNWTNRHGNPIPETANIPNLTICGATEVDTFTANFAIKQTTLNVNYTNGGTATGSGTFDCGSTTSLIATAEGCCYQFAYWTDPSGAIVSRSNPFNYTIEDATPETLTLTANFELKPDQKAITITNGIGSGNVAGAGNYSCGTSTKITALPDSCYIFVNWTNSAGQVVSNDNPLQITVNCDTTLTANFIEHTYQLVTAVSVTNSGGTINLTGTNDVCPVPQKLIATPDSCYQFTSWTDKYGAIIGLSDTIEVVIVSDTSITANFEKAKYDVTLNKNPDAGGNVFGSGNFQCGNNVTITATENSNYTFVNWTAPDSSVISTSKSYTFVLSQDTTLTANFQVDSLNKYILTLDDNPSGVATTLTGAGAYDADTVVSIEAQTTDACYSFFSWTNSAGVEVSRNNPLDVQVISDTALTAEFELKQFNLTTSATKGGTVSPLGTSTRDCNEEVELTATVTDDCYDFKSWTNSAGVVVSTTNPLTVEIISDTTLTANFGRRRQKLELRVNPPLAGTAEAIPYSADGYYDCKIPIECIATANDCYTFKSWTYTEKHIVVSTNNIYKGSFSGDAIMTANFEPKKVNLTVATTEGGTVSPLGTSTRDCNEEVKLTATVTDACYDFKSWTNNAGVVVSTTNPLTVEIISDTTLTANFEPKKLQLTTAATAGGIVSPAGTSTRDCDEEVELTAIEIDDCYEFKQWIDLAGNPVSTVNPLFVFMSKDTMLIAEFELKTYTLEVNTNDISAGTASSEETIYPCGSVVTLTAKVINPCYRFVGWADGTTTNPRAIRLTSDSSITANFELRQFNLTLQAEPPEGGEVFGSGRYDCDSEIEIRAEADECYIFTSWSDGITTNPRTVSLTSDSTITANFELKQFELTLATEPPEGGTVSGTGIYDCNEVITIIATANDGYTFLYWENTETGEIIYTSEVQVIMNGNKHWIAYFQVVNSDMFIVRLLAEPTGAGVLAGGGTYSEGTDIEIIAESVACYEFVKWTTVDGELVSTALYFSHTVTQDTTFVAHFTPLYYNVELAVYPTEAGSVLGDGEYQCGTKATAGALSNACYDFVNWTNNEGKIVSENPNYTFTVTSDTNLTANFRTRIYTITTTENPAGSGTVTGGGEYNCGTEAMLEATANTGFEFLNWSSGSQILSNANPLNLTVISDSAIVANFVARDPDKILIRLQAEPQAGATNLLGGGLYNIGETVSLQAIANTNYTFKNWTDTNGNILSIANLYSIIALQDSVIIAHFESISSNHTVSASASPAGGGTVSGTGNYQANTEVTLEAIAEACYKFKHWTTTTGKIISTENPLIFTINSDTAFIAQFDVINYEVQAQTNPQNSGSVFGTGTYNCSQIAILVAEPNPGFKFVNWTTFANEVLETDDTLQITVANDTTVVANFEQETLPVPIVNFTIRISEHELLDPSLQNYEIPIYITADADISNVIVDELVVTLNKDIFYPRAVSNGNFSNTVTETERVITIKDVKISQLSKDTEHILTKIIGDVILGTSDNSALVLSDLLLPVVNCIPTFALINGYITLDICDFGGQRLVSTNTQAPTLTLKNNPVSEVLEIECSNLLADNYTIEIMDLAGGTARIAEFVVPEGLNRHNVEVSVKDYVNGTYFVILSTQTASHSVKFVIKR